MKKFAHTARDVINKETEVAIARIKLKTDTLFTDQQAALDHRMEGINTSINKGLQQHKESVTNTLATIKAAKVSHVELISKKKQSMNRAHEKTYSEFKDFCEN